MFRTLFLEAKMLRLVVTFCLFICALSLECPSRFEKADSKIPFLYENYYFEVEKKIDASTQGKGNLKQKIFSIF